MRELIVAFVVLAVSAAVSAPSYGFDAKTYLLQQTLHAKLPDAILVASVPCKAGRSCGRSYFPVVKAPYYAARAARAALAQVRTFSILGGGASRSTPWPMGVSAKLRMSAHSFSISAAALAPAVA